MLGLRIVYFATSNTSFTNQWFMLSHTLTASSIDVYIRVVKKTGFTIYHSMNILQLNPTQVNQQGTLVLLVFGRVSQRMNHSFMKENAETTGLFISRYSRDCLNHKLSLFLQYKPEVLHIQIEIIDFPSHIVQITDILDFLHEYCEEKPQTLTEF